MYGRLEIGEVVDEKEIRDYTFKVRVGGRTREKKTLDLGWYGLRDAVRAKGVIRQSEWA